MTDTTDLRAGLIESLRACRDAEREIFGALDPATRDAPGPDGGWSAKDHLAHLSAWRSRQATRWPPRARAATTRACRPRCSTRPTRSSTPSEPTGRGTRSTPTPMPPLDAFIAEIAAASDEALHDQKVLGPILGDGPEHDLGHLGAIAAGVGMSDRVRALADRTLAMLDSGDWPNRAAAYARYNLACYHALNGDLDEARALLRMALPADAGAQDVRPEGRRPHRPARRDPGPCRGRLTAA